MTDVWTIQKYEREPLAPYAQRADKSLGRRHPEREHALRTAFQRDKDRIVHSQAFRRLEYKTQVFVTGNCDHFRTRMTHTIEVAGVTRTIVRSLGLNEDLAETIALAHDIGHPPFGHSGEGTLNDLLKDHGGFDHNLQALVVIDDLEEKYPGYQGLNLSWEVREGLLKHRDESTALDGELLPKQPTLEAQVADVADDLTYLAHDIDDGVLAGLITADDLKGLTLWQLAENHWEEDHGLSESDERYVPFMIRNCIDMMVQDATRSSLDRINTLGVTSPEMAQNHDERLVGLRPELSQACHELKGFLFERIYWHPSVKRDNEEAVGWMRRLYDHFIETPADLGRRSQGRIARVGLHRAVGDYLAMMTDRYAVEEYQRFIAT